MGYILVAKTRYFFLHLGWHAIKVMTSRSDTLALFKSIWTQAPQMKSKPKAKQKNHQSEDSPESIGLLFSVCLGLGTLFLPRREFTRFP